MKLTAHIDKESHQIQIEETGDSMVARIDDRSYQLSARLGGGGKYILINDGSVYDCFVEKIATPPESVKVHVRNRTFDTTIGDPRRLSAALGPSGHTGDGTAQISSPMAGKVVRVLVEQGASVVAGDPIVVVEAMKMQNEMKSPVNGIVKELRTNEGATVNAGEVLAVIS